ncbi:MAG: hypothetical protein MUF25_13800 [Pirellulaceae bacterium]|jgi:hypothetical protein|nr:hypothetical protein [Pirellulaceae bacterium]
MNEWCVVGETVDQAALAGQLTAWLKKVEEGVYVFREGATISQFDWGNERWWSETELDRLWTVRLFCREFELYARRLSYADPAPWQLRIAARGELRQDLPASQPLTDAGTDCVRLLGTATGTAVSDHRTQFDPGSDRYRRARLSYPGPWNVGDSCGLTANRFQPPTGAQIVCWTALTAIPAPNSPQPAQT